MWKVASNTVNLTVNTANMMGGYQRLARFPLTVASARSTSFSTTTRRSQPFLKNAQLAGIQAATSNQLNSYHNTACHSFHSSSSSVSSSSFALSADATQSASRTTSSAAADQQFCPNPYFIAAARLKEAARASPHTLPGLFAAAAGISSTSSSTPTSLDPAAIVKTNVAEAAASLASNETAAEAPTPILLSAIDPGNPLIRFSSECLTWLHTTTGLPWWATLVAAGLVTRVALFPLQIYQGRIAAGIAGLEPHFLVIDMKARQSPHPPFTKFMIVNKLKWALYSKYHCNPFKMLLPTLAQMFVYVIMAVSLRSMVRVNADLATGGALWFTNLGIPDPTYTLPVVAIVASYASSYYLEFSRKKEAMRIRANAVDTLTRKPTGTGSRPPEMFNNPKKAQVAPAATAATAPKPAAEEPPVNSVLDNLMHYARGLSLLLTPLVVQLPSGMFFFWLTSIGWNVASTVLLRQPQVRQYLGYTQREEFLKNRTADMFAAREATSKPAAAAQPVVKEAEIVQAVNNTTSKPSSSPTSSSSEPDSLRSLHKKQQSKRR